MKGNHFFLRIPENAVFWLLLLSLAAGSAVSLYGKYTDRIEIASSGRVLSPIHPASSGAAAAKSPLLSPLDLRLSLEAVQGQESLFFRPEVFP